MGNIYTISELCNLLSVTRPIVEKKLGRLWDKQQVPYTTKTVNNRNIKAIELTLEQEQVLGIIYEGEIDNNTRNEAPIEDLETSYINKNTSSEILEQVDVYATRLESYMERIINAESQVKLIEYKEQSYQNDIEYYRGEISRLTQELNKFQSDNERLRNELEQERKRPFWKKNLI